MRQISRRGLLAGGAVSQASRLLLSPILLSAADAQVTPGVVQFRPEIEPLVELIERTPREKCAEMVVDQMRRGTSYRQLLAALFLAGVRNVNPRPPGFALHCVFVIHAAHLLGLEAPADARLLPLFFALDDFKTSQDRDARAPAGDFTMRPIRGPLPPPGKAAGELAAAMEAWDIDRAERAAASLARNRSAAEVFGLLWRYGARDYRNIGHKAIFTANAYRTLQTIGWQHAEPVLRSLVQGLLDFGKDQQINGYALDDQVYGANLRRVETIFPKLDDNWISGVADRAAALGILGVMRESPPEEACAEISTRLAKGSVSAASVWDAVHLSSAELRVRARRGAALASIHSVTSANALHFAFMTAADPKTRLLLLLQAAGWEGQFRSFAGSTAENLRPFRITDLEPAADGPTEQMIAETFASIPDKLDGAAARAFRLAGEPATRQAFLSMAMRHSIAKADEVHYYKFLAALVEDIPLVSPDWQPHLTATTVYYLKGAANPEPAPMKRAREALRGLTA